MARSRERRHATAGVLPEVPGKRPVILDTPLVVLIVEDDAALRALMVGIFESEGYATVTASDGLEGMEALKRIQPAVMVVDMMMPRMDGPEFIAASAAGGAPIPVVLVSASPRLRETASELGVDYLRKPFDVDDLLDKVQRHGQTPRTGAPV